MKQFGDIESFVKHLGKVAVAEQAAARKGLSAAAKIVEKQAKAKIGHYQEQTGPFIAWPELAEATKADRVKQGYPEDDPLLRTGDMRDSIGTTMSLDGHQAQVGSNSDIAAWQELGTKHMPPRSLLGGAVSDKLPEIRRVMAGAFVSALVGEEVHEGKLLIED